MNSRSTPQGADRTGGSSRSERRAVREILVIGESTMDIVHAPRGRTESPGGSPANVALGLGRLGRPVRFHSALARDPRGERIAAHMTASGVTVDERSWILERTATAIATVHADGSARYDFDISPRLAMPRLERADVVHVGSLSMFLSPGADVLARFLEGLPADVVLSVDPNIRPALLDDPDGARRRFEDTVRRATIVKLSDEDAAWLYPGVPIDHVLDTLLRSGAAVAAITRGSQGAVLASADGRSVIEARPVDLIDTIGAGDTFMAALIDGVVGHSTVPTDRGFLEEVGRYAARAAAHTVQRAGADLPWARELTATPAVSTSG